MLKLIVEASIKNAAPIKIGGSACRNEWWRSMLVFWQTFDVDAII
jgi:hypothetical protein